MGLGRQIIAVTVAAAAAGAVVTVWQQRQEPVYEASTVAVVQASPTTLAASGARPENIVFLARTFAARMQTPAAVDSASRRVGLELPLAEALRRTSATVSPQDATITVRATSADPEDARALSQTLVETVIDVIAQEHQAQREAQLAPLDDEIAELETTLGQLEPGSPQLRAAEAQYQALIAARTEAELSPFDRLEVLSPATLPTTPIAPQPLRSGLLAAIVAAAIAAQLLVTWRLLRPRDEAAVATTPEPAAATRAEPAPGPASTSVYPTMPTSSSAG